MLRDLRDHFATSGVLEVETPLACRSAGTDPALQPITAHYVGPGSPRGETLYLQTSPEFAMKRLLAAGSGPVFQICKAFRDGEAGRLHNPEFTVLEWYRPGIDAHAFVNEVAQVLRLGIGAPDLPLERRRYDDLFAEFVDIDVATTSPLALQACVERLGLLAGDVHRLHRDACLDLLFSHCIQPQLGAGALCAVSDYPVSQAALARINDDGLTAARFEFFHRGIELANGYLELTDVDEQAARFEADNCARRASGLAPIPVDTGLIGALAHGLPDCAGVAVGLDRVLMLRLDVDDIDAVLGFSIRRC